MKSNLKVLVSTLVVGAMAVTLFFAVPVSAKSNGQVAQPTRSFTNPDQCDPANGRFAQCDPANARFAERDPSNARLAERDPANARFAQGAGMYGDPDKRDQHNRRLT
jgi:hypothetical protein